jgi:hypothetical protein
MMLCSTPGRVVMVVSGGVWRPAKAGGPTWKMHMRCSWTSTASTQHCLGCLTDTRARRWRPTAHDTL